MIVPLPRRKKERNPSFSSDGSSQHGFSGSRWPGADISVMKAGVSAENKFNPVNKTPFGSLPPRVAKDVGSFKNDTTSCSS